MTTADNDNAVGRRASPGAFACFILFVLGLIVCGFLWMSIDGTNMVSDIILEVRESPAGNAAFGPVRDEILTIFPSDSLRQTITQHSGKLEYTYSCFEVEEEWLIRSSENGDDILRSFNQSDVFSDWSHSSFPVGINIWHVFTSKDDRLEVLIIPEPSSAEYRINLTYQTPSHSDCHP